MRHLTFADQLFATLDNAVKTLCGGSACTRANPAESVADGELTDIQRRHAAGLMRVNISGEVAAQALYAAQALTARQTSVRDELHSAAAEERDHQHWCSARVRELGARRSLLDPLWYGGAFALGMLAGALGDKVSLGFLAETERQVRAHLDSHLQSANGLPASDAKSRAILQVMRAEEAAHGEHAVEQGAQDLPPPVKAAMRAASKVMTTVAYYF